MFNKSAGYRFLIRDNRFGTPNVSSDIRKHRITQSNLVSANPESLRMMKMIDPILSPPYFFEVVHHQ